MIRRPVTVLAVAVVLAALAATSCRSAFRPKYEYDEDVILALDGSAVVSVNASVPALAALRGVDLNVDPHARLDLRKVRSFFESPVAHVVSATASRRDGRRYVHLRIEVSDIRRLGQTAPFAWSTYRLDRHEDLVSFRQDIGPSAARDIGDVGWRGDELVAFRLHLPSRVPFHNSPSGEIQRGNIIVWEQPLTARLKGEPIAIEVEMESQSILVRTLSLFALMTLLAALTFGVAVWWVWKKGEAVS